MWQSGIVQNATERTEFRRRSEIAGAGLSASMPASFHTLT